MPASKAKVIEQLSQVKNLGESYATSAYEELGVRNLDDLIEAAKANKLQDIKGIGAAKEKKILASAEDLKAESAPAPAPEKKKSSKSKSNKSKSGSKAKAKKEEPKAKKEEPKAKKEEPKAKKEEPKKEKPKAAAGSKSSSNGSKPRQRTTYRPPQPKSRPSIPGLLFKLGKKIIGRILG